MTIKKTREKIDTTDRQILNLIAERFATLDEVLKYKIEHKLPIVDLAREEIVLLDKVNKAKELGLNPILVKSIFKKIILESRKIQKEKLKRVNNVSKR